MYNILLYLQNKTNYLPSRYVNSLFYLIKIHLLSLINTITFNWCRNPPVVHHQNNARNNFTVLNPYYNETQLIIKLAWVWKRDTNLRYASSMRVALYSLRCIFIQRQLTSAPIKVEQKFNLPIIVRAKYPFQQAQEHLSAFIYIWTTTRQTSSIYLHWYI